MVFEFIIDFFVLVFGLCIGSFLNCAIYRMEQEEKITGRSFCPHCKHMLSWKDLFPVFSFLLLKGKCRYCHKRISGQYPLVEISTALIFLAVLNFRFPFLNQFSFSQFLSVAFLFYISSVLIVIFVYDLKHYLIPDEVLLPAIIISFLYRLSENLLIGRWDLLKTFKIEIGGYATFFNFILAALVAAGFFLVIFLVSRGRGMGFGDVKLAVLMGFLLGLPDVLTALFLAFFFGAIIGIILMIYQKKSLKSEIPFGPFLIAGTFMAMLYGGQIIQWYTNFFQI